MEQLKQDHQAISKTIRKLEKWVDKMLESHKEIEEIEQELKSFSIDLDEHFQEEEKGVLKNVASVSPQKEKEVEQICKEHAQMREDVQILCKYFENAKSTLCHFQEKFHRFSSSILEHENKETLLIQDAYLNDLGDKD